MTVPSSCCSWIHRCRVHRSLDVVKLHCSSTIFVDKTFKISLSTPFGPFFSSMCAEEGTPPSYCEPWGHHKMLTSLADRWSLMASRFSELLSEMRIMPRCLNQKTSGQLRWKDPDTSFWYQVNKIVFIRVSLHLAAGNYHQKQQITNFWFNYTLKTIFEMLGGGLFYFIFEFL